MAAAYSDPELLQRTLELSKRFNLTTFCETGTYHGETAAIVSDYFDRVVTVENNMEFFKIAQNRLKDINNCELYFGNSPEIIQDRFEGNDNKVFFFLDAHWYDYLPLLDELSVIKEKCISPVIAIHDFYVPDENGNALFGYDSYKGQPLNYSYIESHVNDLYGDNVEVKYSSSSMVNSGVIYLYPKNK